MRVLPESSWQPVFQRSIDAYYEGQKDEGRTACLLLLNDPGVPVHVREQTYRNQTFYAEAIYDLFPGSHWTELEATRGDGDHCREPSPVWTAAGLEVVLRGEGAGYERLVLNDALHVTARSSLANSASTRPALAHVRPYYNDRLQAAAILRPDDESGHPLAAVVDVEADGWGRIRRLGPRAGDFGRGWSPLVNHVGAHFVAWWEPTEVFRLDLDDAFERVALRLAPHAAERFAGGSQGVPVPGGHLFLVNERVALGDDDSQPLVFSRFVRIDETFQIDAISPQFFVTNRGRDEASGLTRQGERLVAGFSSADQQALLARLEVESVLAALMPITVPGRHRPEVSYAKR
jgi:hypothetical protein